MGSGGERIIWEYFSKSTHTLDNFESKKKVQIGKESETDLNENRNDHLIKIRE